MNIDERVLSKWARLIKVAKSYWVDSEPTGMTDEEFDNLERQAAKEDGFFVRDYVFDRYLKGTKTQNKYIEKIKKFKVASGETMLKAMCQSADELGIPYDEIYCDLKYDGASIAIYLDPNTGRPKRLVTVGNLNLDNLGVDQTWKLLKLIPKTFPLGIKAIQCEALIDTDRLCDTDPEKARQKANGLINSKYCDSDVSAYLTLRAYRYYVDENTYYGQRLLQVNTYAEVLRAFQTIVAPTDGHITFAPAQTWTLQELINLGGDFTETDITKTATGTFLNDGWVLYNKQGVCQRALKFAGAGSGSEIISSTVRSIQWNDQTAKGKDSWSANVIIDPVTIKGCTIRKPSAGSINKLIKNNISVGANVKIILANSTIPMVGDVLSPGNGDFMWPTCKCGYHLSETDTYGSLLKCGNKMCTERIERMRSTVKSLEEIDLDKLLVIDRYKWDVDLDIIRGYVMGNQKEEYHAYLESFLKTPLQKRNLDLVWEASWTVLREKV